MTGRENQPIRFKTLNQVLTDAYTTEQSYRERMRNVIFISALDAVLEANTLQRTVAGEHFHPREVNEIPVARLLTLLRRNQGAAIVIQPHKSFTERTIAETYGTALTLGYTLDTLRRRKAVQKMTPQPVSFHSLKSIGTPEAVPIFERMAKLQPKFGTVREYSEIVNQTLEENTISVILANIPELPTTAGHTDNPLGFTLHRRHGDARSTFVFSSGFYRR